MIRKSRFLLTLLVLILTWAGGILSRSAIGSPTYQRLFSFGTPGTPAVPLVPAVPGTGYYPGARLIVGADGALYGTAAAGGTHGGGTVFKINPDGTGFAVLKDFDFASGFTPTCELVQGSDGTLYGTASQGGDEHWNGTVFRLDPDGTDFAVLLHFDGASTGRTPYAGLIQGSDGKLYGTADQGGTNGCGTVFRLNTDGTGFAVLKDFDSPDGADLNAPLIHGTDGALYGVAAGGGAHGHGTLFKLNTDGTAFTVLVDFDSDTTGRHPFGGLIQAADGDLYGTAFEGGSNGGGTVFRLNPNGTGFSAIVNFDASPARGGNPETGVIQGADGMLYGATSYGRSDYGSIFKVSTDGTGYSVLLDFDFDAAGAYPFGGVMQGPNDRLYGTAQHGGSNGIGTIYRLDSDGSGFTVLKNLSHEIPEIPEIPEGPPQMAETGAHPFAGVIQGTDGILYGTASNGGAYSGGTVYQLAPDGTDFAVVLNMDPATTGAHPQAEVIQGADGALYGTCLSGGALYAGTAFKVNRDGTGATVLRSFFFNGLYETFFEPHHPVGLVQLDGGTLYGTTMYGGASGNGTLFRLEPDGTGFGILVDFDYPTGWLPESSPIRGMDGALYGTTSYGGTLGFGVVFKVNPDGSGYTVLKDLGTSHSWFPLSQVSRLSQGLDGTLYGTAWESQSSGEIQIESLFRLNPDGSGFAVIKTFDDPSEGSLSIGGPMSGVLQGTDGALYGAAPGGGAFNAGTVYRLDPDGSDFEVLFHFDGSATGRHPNGLSVGSDGALYGTTAHGGEYDFGTVYRLVVNAATISSLSPSSVQSGSGGFALTVTGSTFENGAVVQWNGVDLPTIYVSATQLTAQVFNVPATNDIHAALITVRNPNGIASVPVVFLVTASNVAEAVSDVALGGQSASVTIAPVGGGNSAGVSATASNFGDTTPLIVTAAIYDGNPAPGTSFGIESSSGMVGEFMDLQVTGADAADTLNAWFYYPDGTDEGGGNPILNYYDGSAWAPVRSSGGSEPERNTTNNLDGTVSGGRLSVLFDDTSTPAITELGGTFFAITFARPPLGFNGFHSPISGADASGGSFASPLRTFKAGSTIPVKFSISRDGTAVVTGIHRLQAVKYSDETTAENPIDATPQGAATSGNQFVHNGGQWHFNLDTQATGLTKGIWQLAAHLSDGSRHNVWIQIK